MSNVARDLRVQADRVDTALAMRIAETDEVRQRMENELLKVWHSKVMGSSYLTNLSLLQSLFSAIQHSYVSVAEYSAKPNAQYYVYLFT